MFEDGSLSICRGINEASLQYALKKVWPDVLWIIFLEVPSVALKRYQAKGEPLVMVDDVVAEDEACALPQTVQGVENVRQVSFNLALQFGSRVGAQGADHEDSIGLISCAGSYFEIEDQAFGLRR